MIQDDFREIMQYAHYLNWLPDWDILQDIYKTIPMSFSILTPFAFTYLEEIIRSTTTEYSLPFNQRNGSPQRFKVGKKLLELAITENRTEKPEYVALLISIKPYFDDITTENADENRNGILHGHLHPRFWSADLFEKLIHDIALLSKYAGF